MVEVLLKTYPAYVAVNDLPMRDEADKVVMHILGFFNQYFHCY